MKRGLLFIALSLVALAAGAGVFFSSTNGKESRSTETPRIHAVKRTSLQTRVAETGTLEPARTLDVKSQVSGEVKQLLVREGQLVEKHQSLAVIQQEPGEARQIAQLRAALEEERVNVAQAQRGLTRKKTLWQQGYLPRTDFESADQTFQRARVRLDLAKRQLLLALGGNQDLYRRTLKRALSSEGLDEFVLTSAAAGTVLELKVQVGELITSGTATVGGGTILMTLADLTHMVVKAKVNEVHIGRVTIGQPVEIRLDAVPDKMFEGTVAAIAPRGQKTDGIVNYLVQIEIDNTSQSLRPLMTANVDILTKVLSNVITIPLEALRLEKGVDMVQVLVNGGKSPRKVRVGLRTESEAVIVHGLKEGETVVIPSFDETPT